ncbi:ethylene receptor 2-like [Bidens hawaiensis]|uniref:ethylene receptor 2-like n=1 Tax=Bidens hawaiensis TaxID=980011 RepID=UPI00404B9FA9
MSKALLSLATVFLLLICVSGSDTGFSGCNCEAEGFFGYSNIMQTQRVSDFLIAIAYFSIPIELLYFISCSDVPFKWVLVEFILFIVLCGMTHLLHGWTYDVHPFHIMLALTIFKFLTALVSVATAITLITLIPLLLKVKVREFMLRKKFWDLGREMGLIKKQKEAGWHVRMLTHEIRKSLDRHTILYTTLDKLSETLDLQNCAIWMPDEAKTVMNLTHQLKGGESSTVDRFQIPINDSDVQEIKRSEVVKLLEPESRLAVLSSGESSKPGAVAAIRMPMLRVANFKGGTPEMIQTCYAILVLVLPSGSVRTWTRSELEIVKVIADQVAVALSHAAVLEESRLMRDKLVVQNQALQQAKHDALRASQARTSFQAVMSNGLRKPMHSIMGLLSILQDEKSNGQQRVLVDTMVKTSNVISVLINDVMDDYPKDNGKFPFEVRSFRLHNMIKEVACLAKCLCVHKGCDFDVKVDKFLPDNVMGDERRVLQVILHMVGNLLSRGNGGGCLTLRVFKESESYGRNDQQWRSWRSNLDDGYVFVKFEIGLNDVFTVLERSSSDQRNPRAAVEESLSFNMCKKLVQMMQGNIKVVPNPLGFDQSMSLVLQFQLRTSIMLGLSEPGESSSDHKPHSNSNSNSTFTGLQVLFADEDDTNRAVTRKLLEKLGCVVKTVTSGYDCLTVLTQPTSVYQILILDLHMPDLDGFEVASRIRKFRSRNWPLIIGLTTSADEDLWERCIQIGINGIIQKPVLLTGIADELKRVVNQSKNMS